MMGRSKSESTGDKPILVYLGIVCILMVQTGYMGPVRAGLVAIALSLYSLGHVSIDVYQQVKA